MIEEPAPEPPSGMDRVHQSASYAAFVDPRTGDCEIALKRPRGEMQHGAADTFWGVMMFEIGGTPLLCRRADDLAVRWASTRNGDIIDAVEHAQRASELGTWPDAPPHESSAGPPLLARGRHKTAAHGCCAMEAVTLIRGWTWSDRPIHVDSGIAAVVRLVNDRLPGDRRDPLMRPLLEAIADAAPAAPDQNRLRMDLANDWTVRRAAPYWLDDAGMSHEAAALRALPPIYGGRKTGVRAATKLLRAAYKTITGESGDSGWDGFVAVHAEAGSIGRNSVKYRPFDLYAAESAGAAREACRVGAAAARSICSGPGARARLAEALAAMRRRADKEALQYTEDGYVFDPVYDLADANHRNQALMVLTRRLLEPTARRIQIDAVNMLKTLIEAA